MERKLPTMPKREMHGMRNPSTRNLKNDSSSYSTTSSPYSTPVEFSPDPVPLSANIFPPPPPGVGSRRAPPVHADPGCGVYVYAWPGRPPRLTKDAHLNFLNSLREGPEAVPHRDCREVASGRRWRKQPSRRDSGREGDREREREREERANSRTNKRHTDRVAHAAWSQVGLPG